MTDFSDPLGVNEPIKGLDDDIDDTDFELVSPGKESDGESDIDKYFLQNQKSSMANLALDDDLEDDNKDLFVVVDNPEKHTTTMEAYITFRVIAKTSRSEFDNTEYKVRRRYNDFVWLRERLENSQPSHLVPPLPEKHSLKRFDRFNQEFVKTRMHALQKFLQRIADHPVLSFNKYFATFITAKQSEFHGAKKEGSGIFSRVADSFHNMSAAYMMKTRSDEFTDVNDYLLKFGEKIGVLDRISTRLLREQEDYLQALNEWGPIYTLWSNSEDKLSQGLIAMAKTIEKCYLALQELYEATESEYSQPLREYILYTEAVKAVLRRRDAIQMEYEITLEELNRKKEDKESGSESSFSINSMMGKNTEEAKQTRLENLDTLIEKLNTQVEQLQDKSTCADSDLKADMERWHKTKKKDFKKIFMGMCDRQIAYYEKCLKSWEEAIPLIQNTDVISNNTDSPHVTSTSTTNSPTATEEQAT